MSGSPGTDAVPLTISLAMPSRISMASLRASASLSTGLVAMISAFCSTDLSISSCPPRAPTPRLHDRDVEALGDLLGDLAVRAVDVGVRLLLRPEAVEDVESADHQGRSARGGERRPERGDLPLQHRPQRPPIAHPQLEPLTRI